MARQRHPELTTQRHREATSQRHFEEATRRAAVTTFRSIATQLARRMPSEPLAVARSRTTNGMPDLLPAVAAVSLVDHHCHGVVPADLTAEEFERVAVRFADRLRRASMV